MGKPLLDEATITTLEDGVRVEAKEEDRESLRRMRDRKLSSVLQALRDS